MKLNRLTLLSVASVLIAVAPISHTITEQSPTQTVAHTA